MFPPHDISHDERELVDYLLNRLSPDDLERVEEAAVVDDEVAARLRAVEHDLVDAYARGSLSGDTLARFEDHYLLTARRREQATFADRFVRAVDRAAAASPPQPVVVPFRPRPWMVWSLAAAALVLAAASGGLLLQTRRLGQGLAVTQTERAALEARTRDLEQRLAEAQAARDAAASRVERPQEPAKAAATSLPTIALMLRPQTRAIGPLPSLAVPARADRVAIELQLDSNDFPSYQAGLRDPAENTIVWRSAWTAARVSGGQASVVVTVPTDLLKAQHYTLELTARSRGGRMEVVGSYAFEVASP